MEKIEKRILIATTNVGKFKEFTAQFADLFFNFVNLKDIKYTGEEPDEPYNTTWENAVFKARFYAQKTGLLTIAEDTGFYVDYLNGEPGVKAKRLGTNAENRNQIILQALKNVASDQRRAHFETDACVFDPDKNNFYVFNGRVDGIIAEKESKISREGMGYDSIFYFPPLQKHFAEIDIYKKNNVSHRGQIINQIKHFLQKQYSYKQFIVPAAIIIKDRKMLLTQRRDLRPEFNGAWEFPGGGVELSEEIEECLLREVKEETGYDIKIQEILPEILSIHNGEKAGNYKVFLTLYICTAAGGVYKPADAETADHGWFTFEEALKLNLLPLNKRSIQAVKNYKILKKYID